METDSSKPQLEVEAARWCCAAAMLEIPAYLRPSIEAIEAETGVTFTAVADHIFGPFARRAKEIRMEWWRRCEDYWLRSDFTPRKLRKDGRPWGSKIHPPCLRSMIV